MIAKILNNRKLIICIWVLLAIGASLKQYFTGRFNNYLIYKNVFYHSLEQKSLYATYPALYFDHNHYGPIFSLFIK